MCAQVRISSTHLNRTHLELHAIAFDRVQTSTDTIVRFQHGNAGPGYLQLIGRRHAGQARTNHENVAACRTGTSSLCPTATQAQRGYADHSGNTRGALEKITSVHCSSRS